MTVEVSATIANVDDVSLTVDDQRGCQCCAHIAVQLLIALQDDLVGLLDAMRQDICEKGRIDLAAGYQVAQNDVSHCLNGEAARPLTVGVSSHAIGDDEEIKRNEKVFVGAGSLDSGQSVFVRLMAAFDAGVPAYANLGKACMTRRWRQRRRG